MLHVDIPTLPELRALIGERADACVSLYLGTTPESDKAVAIRIAFGNHAKNALGQLEADGFDKRRLALLRESLDNLAEDDEFWQFQANSLAVLATPDRIRTFRLATAVSSVVEVSDRFYLKPMLRAVAFPQHALVLALSENAVKLVEIFGDEPPAEIRVPDLPASAADAVGRASINNLTQGTRISNAQGQTVLLRKYARAVDAALRPVLAGRETPLILAATDPLAPIFRNASSYPALLEGAIKASPDRMSDAELAEAARPVLDAHYAAEVAGARELYANRVPQGRTSCDLQTAARAATYGAVEVVLVDMDEVVPGTVDEEDGTVALADAAGAGSYGVVDEIAGRALLTGAKVLAVRKDDLPEAAPLAVILRYPV